MLAAAPTAVAERVNLKGASGPWRSARFPAEFPTRTGDPYVGISATGRRLSLYHPITERSRGSPVARFPARPRPPPQTGGVSRPLYGGPYLGDAMTHGELPMDGYRILAVDDDPALLRALRRGLRLEGFAVRTAGSGREALQIAAEEPPDAIVLDVSMPGMSGIEVCACLRERGAEVPVLMLSAMDEVADRVAGLAAGADDYVIKPYDLGELVLRLRALLRRSGRTAAGHDAPHAGPAGGPVSGRVDDRDGAAMRMGPLTVDPAARRVTVHGRRVELTRREFDLLETLALNAGIVLTRQLLLERVWGYDFEVTDNAVDTFVGYLRRKLEAAGEPRLVHTVRGVGFVLRVGPE